MWRVEERPGVGRVVVVTRLVEPGQELWRERPLLSGPARAPPGPVCLGCGDPVTGATTSLISNINPVSLQARLCARAATGRSAPPTAPPRPATPARSVTSSEPAASRSQHHIYLVACLSDISRLQTRPPRPGRSTEVLPCCGPCSSRRRSSSTCCSSTTTTRPAARSGRSGWPGW